MKLKWNDKTLSEIRMIISVIVVVNAVLQLADIWDNALNVSVPLLGIVILIQSIQEYKEHKASAILGYCCAAFIFICSIAVWFMK